MVSFFYYKIIPFESLYLLKTFETTTKLILNSRHPNFDIGASEEVKIFTNASCCIERMNLEAIGISEGESQSVSILSNGGSGGDESSGSEYHLTAIVSIITFCVIMGVVLAALFYRRKRRSFSL